MSQANTPDSGRRKFLRNAAVAGAVAPVAAAVPSMVQAQEPEVEQPAVEQKSKNKGYQVTQHVRDYYKTAAL